MHKDYSFNDVSLRALAQDLWVLIDQTVHADNMPELIRAVNLIPPGMAHVYYRNLGTYRDVDGPRDRDQLIRHMLTCIRRQTYSGDYRLYIGLQRHAFDVVLYCEQL